MKFAFTGNLHMDVKNRIRLDVINKIIEEYRVQGYRLTLRQLYYQLVSRDIVPNNVKEYGKLSILLKKGRMAGIVDWDAIEDRIRVPNLPYWVTGVKDALEDTARHYRLDRMKGQENYIELWVEKDALSGVLKRITHKFHVNLMVNRGYSSCTAMHDASERILRAKDRMQQSHILYLGDHDPSGLDMVRDIEDRLVEFGASDFEIHHVALTDEQIKKYKPPTNPAKFKDPRAKDYIREYGAVSWEVDALKPEVLSEIVTKSITDLIDIRKFTEICVQEEKDKAKLLKIAKRK